MLVRNFESLKPYVTKKILAVASKYLNEFENAVFNAVDMANNIVLNQLLDNLKNSEKVKLVFENVNKISPNAENILENLGSTLGDNSGLTVLSTNFLELFFDKQNNVHSTEIAAKCFVKQESANAVIKMSSILILCYLAKNKLTIANLEKHFIEDKTISEAAPKAFVPNLLDSKLSEDEKKIVAEKLRQTTVQRPQQNAAESQTDEKSGSSKKIFVVIGLVAALAIGGFLLMNGDKKSSNKKIEDIPIVVTDSETQVEPIEGESITTLGDFVDFTLPSDEIITVPENGIEKALIDLALDKSKTVDESSYWLQLDRVHFDGRESDCKVDSEEQIKNLSLIMTAFPKLEINIGCYTDNLGNPASNLELSSKRAESLKDKLVELGISDSRITTEGFGSGFPIAENNTPENQKMNRRISIKITKK